MSLQRIDLGEDTTAGDIALEILNSDVNVPPMPAVGTKIVNQLTWTSIIHRF